MVAAARVPLARELARRGGALAVAAALAGPAASARAAAAPPPPTETPKTPEAAKTDAAAAPKPPRVDGPYLGLTGFGGVGVIRVNDLDNGGAFGGFGGALRVGEAVLDWLTIGLQIGGAMAFRPRDAGDQRLGQGHLMVEFGFLPIKRVPFSLRTGFGFGGGAVRQDRVSGRSGFGGAVFNVAARYEFFPGAAKRRPNRGGGFGLGPEIGWLGATPAAPGRPMSNLFYLGLAMTFYFGS